MFITVEGTEGAGKTTLIEGLKKYYSQSSMEVFFTREPGASSIGSTIRKLLLEGEKLSALTELFLFLADRAEHVESIIKPKLESGCLVICDRYTDSTLAYQGYARGLDIEMLRMLNHTATGALRPDLTIFMDISPEFSLKRTLKNDRMDLESMEFHKKVYDGFITELEKEPGRWLRVDANQPPEKILRVVCQEIEKRQLSR